MKTAIIMPTYNEAENIVRLIPEIFSLNIQALRLIVIDDNSPDGAGAIVSRLNQDYPVEVIRRSQKSGIGSAYIAGFKKSIQAGDDLIFEMDADFSHDPLEISNFIGEINKGADVVIGSRYIPQGDVSHWSPARRLMSRSAIWLARIILKLKTHDVTSGFRCYRREVLVHLDLEGVKSNGYAFQEEILYRCEKLKVNIVEIPIQFIDRSAGRSKLSSWEIVQFFYNFVSFEAQI